MSWRKIFQLGEGRSVRFTADACAFDHVNFNAPNTTTSSSSFGSQPARHIQFGARLQS